MDCVVENIVTMDLPERYFRKVSNSETFERWPKRRFEETVVSNFSSLHELFCRRQCAAL